MWILIVMSILTIVGRYLFLAIEGPRATKVSLARIQLETIAYKILSYREDRKVFPDPGKCFTDIAFELDEKYSHGLVDPWGKGYRYSQIEGAFTVETAGPDGKFGTMDDIIVKGFTNGVVKVLPEIFGGGNVTPRN